jgi:uncharacterized protein
MMQKILITGGSGLIGKQLSKKLADKSYEIRILGRQKIQPDNFPYQYYSWDINQEIIDTKALENIDYVINLTGENISEKRWTKEQKLLIERSRVNSTKLLYKVCNENNTWPKAFISSSAIGYYGTFNSEKILTEESQAGNDFLAQVCEKWEKAANLFAEKGIRTVKIRTGVVLSKYGGAYDKISKLTRKGLAAAIGSGKQYIPWIHIDDIVNIFIKAIEDEHFEGVYNGIAPQHITNKEFTKAVIKSLNQSLILPNIPSFILKATYGEMSDILLKGSRISSDKLLQANFQFEFPDLEQALIDLVNS